MTETLFGTTILETIIGILLAIGFVFVVFLMGFMVQECGISFFGKKSKSVANVAVIGFISTIALSQLLLVPLTLYDVHVLPSTIIWWVVFGVISIVSVVKCHDEIKETFASFVDSVKEFCVKKRCGGTYGILAMLLIAVQLVGSLLFYHYDDDDSIYVTMITANIDDDNFVRMHGQTGEKTTLWQMSEYMTNGWYHFLTVVSKATHIPAAILMHTVLPVLLLGLAYTVVVIFARIVIKKESQRYLFLVFVSLINILNNVSTHTSSSVLLMRIHQGKALFANIVVPIMFCVFYLLWQECENKKLIWLLLIANICACAFTTSGLVFAAVLSVVFAAFLGIRKHSIKLCFWCMMSALPNVVYAALYIIERNLDIWE